MDVENEEKKLSVESKRLDWLIANPSAKCERSTDGTLYINAWVCNGEPGNENGGGANFTASGATHRDCIDKFMAGDIRRMN